MSDDFYEWINNCPVQWFRVSYEDGVAVYQFIESTENQNDTSNR
jgi:hypothetical protein